MEATLGHRYEAESYVCRLRGWRRSWDAFMPNQVFYEQCEKGEFAPNNIVYLNIKPCSESSVNGLLYVLENDQVGAFDQREWIYERRPITTQITDVTIKGGEAYAYICKPEWLLDLAHASREHAGLRRTYIEMIERGVDSLGGEFRDCYKSSTELIPADLVFSDLKRPPVSR